jgi:hypothetical protein
MPTAGAEADGGVNVRTFNGVDLRKGEIAQRRNERTFWQTERGSPLKGWGASGSSKSRVVGDDRPGTGLRAHLSRASTAGGQQSKSVASGEGPQLGGARAGIDIPSCSSTPAAKLGSVTKATSSICPSHFSQRSTSTSRCA